MCVCRLRQKDFGSVKSYADVGLKLSSMAQLDEELSKATDAKLWYLKGQANSERGFSEDAVEAFKKAEELVPGDPAVRQALTSSAKTRREDQESAKEVWKQKLMTEDEVRARGPWWYPSTMIAKLREQR